MVRTTHAINCLCERWPGRNGVEIGIRQTQSEVEESHLYTGNLRPKENPREEDRESASSRILPFMPTASNFRYHIEEIQQITFTLLFGRSLVNIVLAFRLVLKLYEESWFCDRRKVKESLTIWTLFTSSLGSWMLETAVWLSGHAPDWKYKGKLSMHMRLYTGDATHDES